MPAAKGEARYAPVALMRTSLLGVLYAIPSSRKLERACQESLPFRVVSGNQCPDHNTLHRFLRAHQEACASMLQLSVDLANDLGIVGWEFQAVDGTKIQANATSGKAMTRAQLAEVRRLSDARITPIQGGERTLGANYSRRVDSSSASSPPRRTSSSGSGRNGTNAP